MFKISSLFFVALAVVYFPKFHGEAKSKLDIPGNTVLDQKDTTKIEGNKGCCLNSIRFKN